MDAIAGNMNHLAKEIMCGACGEILRLLPHIETQFCSRCGVKLNPQSIWDIQLCNTTHDTPNIARVRKTMIGQYVRVTIKDGRIFVGRFLAFDKQRSMILSESREYRRVKVESAPGTHCYLPSLSSKD